LIDKETNVRISDRAPSDYLAEMRKELGEDHLIAVLESHLLPANAGSPLWLDQFDEFLRQRQAILASTIGEATG